MHFCASAKMTTTAWGVYSLNRRKWNGVFGFLCVLPFLCVIFAFMIVPVFEVFRGSFFAQKLNGTQVFVGLKNYKSILGKDYFTEILLNTVIWVGATVILKQAFGLWLAMIMEKQIRGKRGFQLLTLLPWATPWIVAAVLFKWLFDGLYGYINSFLYTLGLIAQPIDFLGSSDFSIWAVIIANVWTGIPFCAFTYLAVLNSIPKYLYEAAELDGASALASFRYVTLPQIMPTMQLMTVLLSIWGINSFDFIYTMTEGGPVYASETLVSHIYRLGFTLNNKGQANALSVIVFIIMLVLVLIYLYKGRSNEEHA